MATLPAGTRLGRYEIRTLLGAGGMAEVYLAEDTDLGRRVALKLLPPETADDEAARKRLAREARAAAALDHANICAVYEVDEADGRLFIAMQFVDGETLDARLRRAPLDIDQALDFAVQIVDGVAEAHRHGILHRDLKPGNVMITPRGQARVMDFGLAKPATERGGAGSDAAAAEATEMAVSLPGMVLGTWPYMSPEQVRGEPLDPRTDLFSLGVVIYEMVAGRRPFEGASSAEVASAILAREPLPLPRFAPTVPPELERIVGKAIRKSADARYQTAQDLFIDLKALKEERDFQRRLERTPVPAPSTGTGAEPPRTARDVAPEAPPAGPSTGGTAAAAVSAGIPAAVPVETGPSRRGARWPVLTAVVLAALAMGGWFAYRQSNLRWASAQLPRIASLAQDAEYFGAYDLAVSVEPYLGGNATLAGLMPVISDTLSVTSEPSGARVYLKRFVPGTDVPRELIGETPLANVRIARGDYVLSVEKDGYAPFERSVSGRGVMLGPNRLGALPMTFDLSLRPAGDVPAGMVFVPGGRYRLTGWSRPTDRLVELADYFIDRHEVSNADFKEFVSAGGYLKREYWRETVIHDGRPLSWEDAMRLFVDQTGLPGPRGWSNQNPPDGREDHPVTGISWYEATAYAVFRGKSLPTVFQWEKAARNGTYTVVGATMPWGITPPGEDVAARANFGGRGTMPVTSLEFGMSPFGALHMAGNAVEWTRNDTDDGYFAAGGGWTDPAYTFALLGPRPGTLSSAALGFRLAQLARAGGVEGAERIELEREVPHYAATSEAEFARLAQVYRYEPQPLDATVEDTVETPEWTRETISFRGANDVRVTAYLYMPRHVPRPVQVLHYVPAADVDGGIRPLDASIEDRMIAFVKAGRAVFGVVLEGYVGRTSQVGPRPDRGTVEFQERVVNRVTDVRRGLDYLGTREDIDRERIAFFGPSAGAQVGLILAAVERRYRVVVMVGAGLPDIYGSWIATANPVNFTPHIRAPKFILQGRYDEDTPLRTAAEPMFALMREPKRLVLYDGGHVPSAELAMRATTEWLDEQLGRVTR